MESVLWFCNFFLFFIFFFIFFVDFVFFFIFLHTTKVDFYGCKGFVDFVYSQSSL